MYTRMNNPLNQFITAQEVHFLIISSLFSFLFSSSITRKSSEQKILEKSQIIATYTHCIIHKFQLNPFITAQEMDFLIISLFSFLYLSGSITGEIANEKF